MPYAGGTGEDQLWPQVLPGDVLRRMRSILQELLRNSVGHDGINHSSLLQSELIVKINDRGADRDVLRVE